MESKSLADRLRHLVDDAIVSRTTADGINVSRATVRKIADQVQRVEEQAITLGYDLTAASEKIAAAREALEQVEETTPASVVRECVAEALEALGE